MKKVFLFFMILSFLHAETKVALVIGNGEYKNKPLPNAPKDALDIYDKLKKLNYHIEFAQNVNTKKFGKMINTFHKKMIHADIAVVFYAGHGIQIGEENYLIPTDVESISSYNDLNKLIKLSSLVEEVKDSKKFGVLFIDACRDNPLKNNIDASIRSSVSRGLRQIDTPSNIVVSFATKAGQVTSDGKGNNSPYTNALKKFITNNEDIRFVIGKVKDNVVLLTKNDPIKQTPSMFGTLGGSQFCITGSCSETAYVPTGVTIIGKLMYETKPAKTKLNWEDAKSYCENKFLGEYKDWKLPNKEELHSISNTALYNWKDYKYEEIPRNKGQQQEWQELKQKNLIKNKYGDSHYLQSAFIDNVPTLSIFWTSSEVTKDIATVISFNKGIIAKRKKSDKYHVLCIRQEKKKKEKSFWQGIFE